MEEEYYNQHMVEAVAYHDVMTLLEDVSVNTEWMFTFRSEKLGINNYPITEEIKKKLELNKVKSDYKREHNINPIMLMNFSNTRTK